jgi:starch-binding outer membrane protein, SusD/RagB family
MVTTSNHKIMKILKINYLVIITLLLIGLFLQACDSILNIPPKGSLSEDVLSNEQGLRATLIGAYGALDGGVIDHAWRNAPGNWIYGSVRGGDAHKGSTPGDQGQILSIMLGQAEPNFSYLNSRWSHLYEGISRANAVLSLAEEVPDMDETAKVHAVAEARFLRGHFYFELRRNFNMVPWIDENTTDFNQPNDRDIWPDIEADFQFAMENLPEIQSERARVNRWAAAAYLAKTYVYQEKWNDAKPLYDNIIANGVTSTGISYDLFENFRDNWEPAMESVNPEAVFFVQQVANEGTGNIYNANRGIRLNYPYNSPFLCCGFYQPTQDLVNSFRTDNDGLPFIDSYNDEMVTNDMHISSNDRFDDFYMGNLDPRLDWTAGRRGAPYLDWGPHPGQTWVRDQGSAGPYANQKEIYWQSRQDVDADLSEWSPGSAINTNIIRFADVLLMAAEVEAQLNNLGQALEYVNRVRNRAANSVWVNIDHNRQYALAEVNSEAEMLTLDGVSTRDWVIREDRESTFVFLGGDSSDPNRWQEYEDPNDHIGEYSAFNSQQDALQKIYFERKIELAMEGHRFYDLVRWGLANEQYNTFFAYESQITPIVGVGNFSPGRDEYLPIPQSQIDLSRVDGVPLLQQNPGY